MAKIITVEKNGYTLQVAVTPDLKKQFTRTVKETATGMLLYLLKSANMQKSADYVFHLSDGTYVDYTNHQMCMYLKNHTRQGWRMGIRFGSSDEETVTGSLQLPRGMSPESTLVKLRRAIKWQNDNGWKDFLRLTKQAKLAKSQAPKSPNRKSSTIAPTQTSQTVLVGMVRKLRVAKSLLEAGFTIDLARVLEIQIRSREIEVKVQQFQEELDAYCQHGKGSDRIPAIQQCLQELASEVKALLLERKAFETVMRARTRAQLIKDLLG